VGPSGPGAAAALERGKPLTYSGEAGREVPAWCAKEALRRTQGGEDDEAGSLRGSGVALDAGPFSTGTGAAAEASLLASVGSVVTDSQGASRLWVPRSGREG